MEIYCFIHLGMNMTLILKIIQYLNLYLIHWYLKMVTIILSAQNYILLRVIVMAENALAAELATEF